MYKAIINVGFSIHELLPVGCSPNHKYAGKAMFVIDCDSVEEGVELIKKKLSKSNFIITKEDKGNDIRRNISGNS